MLATELDGMQVFCLFVIPGLSVMTVLAAGRTRRQPPPGPKRDPYALAERLVREADEANQAMEGVVTGDHRH